MLHISMGFFPVLSEVSPAELFHWGILSVRIFQSFLLAGKILQLGRICAQLPTLKSSRILAGKGIGGFQHLYYLVCKLFFKPHLLSISPGSFTNLFRELCLALKWNHLQAGEVLVQLPFRYTFNQFSSFHIKFTPTSRCIRYSQFQKFTGGGSNPQITPQLSTQPAQYPVFSYKHYLHSFQNIVVLALSSPISFLIQSLNSSCFGGGGCEFVQVNVCSACRNTPG